MMREMAIYPHVKAFHGFCLCPTNGFNEIYKYKKENSSSISQFWEKLTLDWIESNAPVAKNRIKLYKVIN